MRSTTALRLLRQAEEFIEKHTSDIIAADCSDGRVRVQVRPADFDRLLAGRVIRRDIDRDWIHDEGTLDGVLLVVSRPTAVHGPELWTVPMTRGRLEDEGEYMTREEE